MEPRPATIESPDEMLSRLRLIASGDRDCDMSDNDLAALRWLLRQPEPCADHPTAAMITVCEACLDAHPELTG